MRVLITGVTGFVGPYVAEHLAAADHDTELWGLRWGAEDPGRLAGLGERLRLVDGDVTDPASLRRALAAARPDALIHLAATSSVARSWSHAARALEINAIGTVNLFETLSTLDLRPMIVVASSAEVYGGVSEASGPIAESGPIQPISPYGTSKAAQDFLTAQFGAACDLPAVRLRPFHTTGPGRPVHFVASSFAHQIATIEAGDAAPVIRVGNLDGIRDINDVRDVARAYRLAATLGQPGEAYNVCTGRPVRIRQILDTLLELSGAEIEVRIDPDRVRPIDVPWQVGDPTKFHDATGWSAEIPLRRTLSDLLDWWRERV